MIEKSILHIDMDGVIADFDKGVQLLEPGMPWDRENVDRVCEANSRIFEHLPEMEDGIESVKRIKDSDKYQIFFLSTPMCNVHDSYTGKAVWLYKKFGDWSYKKLILTHRKDLVMGDYLIDDRIANGVDRFIGKHIHFGTREFPNWDSILKYLEI